MNENAVSVKCVSPNGRDAYFYVRHTLGGLPLTVNLAWWDERGEARLYCCGQGEGTCRCPDYIAGLP